MSASHLISACHDALCDLIAGRYIEATQWWTHHRDAVWAELCATSPPDDIAQILLGVACYMLEIQSMDYPPGLGALVDSWYASTSRDQDTDLHVMLWCWRARHLCLDGSRVDTTHALFDTILRQDLPGLGREPLCPLATLDIPVEFFVHLSYLRLLTLTGELDQALALCCRVLDELTAQRADMPWGLVQELWHYKGILEQWSSDYEASRESLYTAYLIAYERGAWQLAASAQSMLAQLQQLDGELELARQTYDQVDELVAKHALEPGHASSVYVRAVRLFLYLEIDQYDRALAQSRELVEELVQSSAQIPLQIARSVLVMAAHGTRDDTLARAHFNILSVEIAHQPDPLSPLGEMLDWLWHPERMQHSTLEIQQATDRNLFLRFAERALGHLLGVLPTRQAIRYHRRGEWFEMPGKEPERRDLRRKHTARRALLAMIEAGARGLTHERLIARVWPDEQIAHQAALTRLRVLMHQLRSMGLREIILTTEHGYRLDQSIPFIAEH